MESIYYIGLDVHKKSIAYCIKTVTGNHLSESQHYDKKYCFLPLLQPGRINDFLVTFFVTTPKIVT